MTMLPDARAVLEAVPDPIFVVRVDGTVEWANKAASSLAGNMAGANLADLAPEDRDRLRNYLRRCSGSKDPLIGRITLRESSGRERTFRCHGNAIRPRTEAAPALVMVRLLGPPEERFSALSKQIDDLHVEIRKRRRIQANLEEALRDRQLLLRELNHRVRNNLQMLLSMLSSERLGTQNAEARTILDRACSRVAAIGAAQQVLYAAGIQSVETAGFVGEVCQTIMRAFGSRHALALDVDAAELSNDLAAPLALILNELITNAVKHAFRDGEAGRIEVAFRAVGDGFELAVADNGIGFDGGVVREGGSGLGLVRGLTRKMGGQLTVVRDRGTRCVVQFRDRARAEARQEEGSSNVGTAPGVERAPPVESAALHSRRQLGG
jgi:two-component sensor histidine kinase